MGVYQIKRWRSLRQGTAEQTERTNKPAHHSWVRRAVNAIFSRLKGWYAGASGQGTIPGIHIE